MDHQIDKPSVFIVHSGEFWSPSPQKRFFQDPEEQEEGESHGLSLVGTEQKV